MPPCEEPSSISNPPVTRSRKRRCPPPDPALSPEIAREPCLNNTDPYLVLSDIEEDRDVSIVSIPCSNRFECLFDSSPGPKENSTTKDDDLENTVPQTSQQPEKVNYMTTSAGDRLNLQHDEPSPTPNKLCDLYHTKNVKIKVCVQCTTSPATYFKNWCSDCYNVNKERLQRQRQFRITDR